MRKILFPFLLALMLGAFPVSEARAGKAVTKVIADQVVKVIFDTDIGDDIDDAFALAMLLHSPEVRILGVTTAFGDTHLRARLVTRLLKETGNQAIPVFEGQPTGAKTAFSQAAWAGGSPDRQYPGAVSFVLDMIRKNPGEITLLSVAPFTNVGALLAKDPATFRKLKRVVIMGGSVNRGYGPHGENDQPDPEWNILCDIPAAKALFASGVPLYVMPLDSTQIKLDRSRREAISGKGTPLAKALGELTREWSVAAKQDTPTLFDVVAAAYVIRPAICPMTTMRLEVDDKGFTRKVAGKPNAHVCLSSNTEDFFDLFLPRVLQ